MSDPRIENMTAEELEAQLAANKVQDKAEQDSRTKRNTENRAMHVRLAHLTAKGWLIVFDDNSHQFLLLPVSEKTKTRCGELTFSTGPEPDDLNIDPKPAAEVRIEIQVDPQSDTTCLLRLRFGKNISFGTSYKHKGKTHKTEYAVWAFSSLEEAEMQIASMTHHD